MRPPSTTIGISLLALLAACGAPSPSSERDGGLPDRDGAAADAGRPDGGPTDGASDPDGGVDASSGRDAAPPPDAGGDPCESPGVHCYYLSPSGSDTGAGTMTDPWFSLVRAWNDVAPGDVIYLRGGSYGYDTMQYLQLKNGAEGALIHVWAFPGEQPIITRGAGYAVVPGVNQDLIYLEGNYLHWRGIEIANFDQRPGETPYTAFRTGFTNHSIFENINYHHNASGFQIRGDSTDNLIVNSDFHHNQDPYGADGAGASAYDGADGLDVTWNNNVTTHNVIRGCRAYWNADDGFDLWANDGDVVIESSWSFYNGYIPGTFDTAGNGTAFKLGITGVDAPDVVKRTVRGCIGYRNRSHGIVENNANTRSAIYNNTMAMSGEFGYWFGDWHPTLVAILQNNISWNNPGSTWSVMGGEEVNAASIVDHNSWQGGLSVSDADFESVDASQLLLPRRADGALPDITFLHLAAGSDLVDQGTNVGAPFTGSAPDIGAFER